MKIITRAKAIEKGLPHYFTGNECKNGHLSKRRTLNGGCVDCGKVSIQRHREKIRSIAEGSNTGNC